MIKGVSDDARECGRKRVTIHAEKCASVSVKVCDCVCVVFFVCVCDIASPPESASRGRRCLCTAL